MLTEVDNVRPPYKNSRNWMAYSNCQLFVHGTIVSNFEAVEYCRQFLGFISQDWFQRGVQNLPRDEWNFNHNGIHFDFSLVSSQ